MKSRKEKINYTFGGKNIQFEDAYAIAMSVSDEIQNRYGTRYSISGELFKNRSVTGSCLDGCQETIKEKQCNLDFNITT